MSAVPTRTSRRPPSRSPIRPTGISTRAVCEAAGVSAPSIYHYFGDKEGLFTATVDFGWGRSIESKREAAAATHDDVADDLRAGWDNHLQFAHENPGIYRLLWSPAVSGKDDAAVQAHEMLRMVLSSAPRAASSVYRQKPPPASSWPPTLELRYRSSPARTVRRRSFRRDASRRRDRSSRPERIGCPDLEAPETDRFA